MSTKPPTQVAAPGGINAHGAMGANNRHPHVVLRERAKEPRFRQFIATHLGVLGPMTEARTIEAVFRYVGADSWSSFMTGECLTLWRDLLTDYESTF